MRTKKNENTFPKRCRLSRHRDTDTPVFVIVIDGQSNTDTSAMYFTTHLYSPKSAAHNVNTELK